MKKVLHSNDPDQRTMFNPTRAVAHHRAPETSHAAAKKVNLPKRCRQVVELLKHYGPMTDEEMNTRGREQGLRLFNTGLAPARCMMTPPNGVGIMDSGERRRGASTREHVVWKLDPERYPEVAPAAIRSLRDSQRTIYELFRTHGDMNHAEVYAAYTATIDENAEEIMTASGVRTRVAELVDAKIVELKKSDIPNIWGLRDAYRS